MKNLITLFLFMPLFLNGQDNPVHTISSTLLLDGGHTTRTINFYVNDGDTLAQSVYQMQSYRNGKYEEIIEDKIPFDFFKKSQKTTIIRFVNDKLSQVLFRKHAYTFEVNFVDMWQHPVTDSTFDLNLYKNNKIYSFTLPVMVGTDELKRLLLE